MYNSIIDEVAVLISSGKYDEAATILNESSVFMINDEHHKIYRAILDTEKVKVLNTFLAKADIVDMFHLAYNITNNVKAGPFRDRIMVLIGELRGFNIPYADLDKVCTALDLDLPYSVNL